jgi:hypothetical protein
MPDEIPGPAPSRRKRRYATPEVRKVRLRPEEAVLGNCKSATVSGPGQANCSTPASCFTIGS